MSKLEWHLPWLIGLLTGIVCYLLLYHSGFSNIHSKSICFGLIIAAIHLQLASPSTQLRQWLLPAVLVGIAFAYLGISLTNRQSFEPLVTLQLPLALLISTSFHQVYCREQKAHFPYQLLFFHAWNTPITLLIAGAFTAVAWGLIEAWSMVFSAIGIAYFHVFFHHDAVVIIVLATLFGLGITILKQYQHIINTLRILCLSLFKIIYIPIIFISILFFISLPFGKIAMNDNWPIIFVINAWTLLLFNAVYQDGEQAPFLNPVLRYANAALLLLLPLTVCVGLYNCLGMLLRQGSHQDIGLTVDSLIYGCLLLLYSSSYAVALFKQPYWHYHFVRQVNPKLAIIMGITLYLMATPLMELVRRML